MPEARMLPAKVTSTCRIIAHRGASAYLPEHTLAAYALAIRQGADFIEPDLVMTADGVLVARHERRLELSTDVASRPDYADRRRTEVASADGQAGWFSEDFSLAELRSLRARERLPEQRPHGRRYDGLFQVPTLQEIIGLLRRLEQETGRVVGLCPELKQPAHFAALGLDMPGRLVQQLAAGGYRDADAPVWLQCFDAGVLRELHECSALRLMQLVEAEGAQAILSPAGLAEVASYAAAIAPDKGSVLAADGDRLFDTGLVAAAHAVGLQVYPWLSDGQNTAELQALMALGVDGLFTDFPDLAVAARASRAGR
jgi:glycerophosphoryl diester phosphodiesterase